MDFTTIEILIVTLFCLIENKLETSALPESFRSSNYSFIDEEGVDIQQFIPNSHQGPHQPEGQDDQQPAREVHTQIQVVSTRLRPLSYDPGAKPTLPADSSPFIHEVTPQSRTRFLTMQGTQRAKRQTSYRSSLDTNDDYEPDFRTRGQRKRINMRSLARVGPVTSRVSFESSGSFSAAAPDNYTTFDEVEDENITTNAHSSRRQVSRTSGFGRVPTHRTTLNVFPGWPFLPTVGVSGPICANGKTYCTNTDYYPSYYVENVLRLEEQCIRELLGEDELAINSRILDLDGTELCPSEEHLVYPKMAMNAHYDWLFIINHGIHIQGVRVDECLRERTRCNSPDRYHPGYKMICKQKYSYRRMVALNADGKPYADYFKMPSSCACFLSDDYPFVRPHRQASSSKQRSSDSSSSDSMRARHTL